MSCPNCGREVARAGDVDGHAAHCILAVLLAVLLDRGHELSGIDVERVDADAIWHGYIAPAADFLAEQLGLDSYPAEEQR